MDRRQALTLLARGMVGALAVRSVAGCAPGDEAAAATRVDLTSIPDGGRLEIDHRGRPVELRRQGDAVEARSLWCTHFGCVVHWDPASGEYLCPCHDGRFDSRGRPIDGPPTRPLRAIPVTLASGVVTLADS